MMLLLGVKKTHTNIEFLTKHKKKLSQKIMLATFLVVERPLGRTENLIFSIFLINTIIRVIL